MPRTISQSLKYEVFAADEGIRLGKPQDMLIDPEHHKVALVILVHRTVPQAATVIDGREIRSFAEDTLPIAALKSVHLAYQVAGSVELLERSLQFRGRDIITSTGHNVGRILDALLDDDGTVIEYRAAKGFFRRLLRITTPVTPAQLRTAGEQVAVAVEETEEPGEKTDAQ